MANISKLEMKILKKVAESQLITKAELRNFLKDGPDARDLGQVVDSATKGLIDKRLLTAISPVGSTCYIITQQGTRLLNEMNE